MPKQQPLLIASRFPQLLSIAVLILFVHAIFQQSIISSMREELRVALGGDKSATSSSVKGVDFHTYLNFFSLLDRFFSIFRGFPSKSIILVY